MTQELTVKRGDDATLSVAVTLDGAAVDISDPALLIFMVKERYSDADEDALITKRSDVNGEITKTDPTEGECSVALVPGDTEDLPAREVRLVYNMKLRDSQGKIYTLDQGAFIVTPTMPETVS